MTLWSFLKSRLDTLPRVLSSQSPVRILANGALGQVRVEPLWAAREPAREWPFITVVGDEP